MTLLIAVGVILMVVTAAGVLAWDRHQERQRTDAVAATSGALGLQFQAEPGEGALSDLPAFPLLSQERGRIVSNVFSGQHRSPSFSGPVRLFDYSYLADSGSETERYSQTALYLDTSGKLRIPDFALRSKTVADRVEGALGITPSIDLGGEFSRDHVLTGPDEAAVRSLFSAPVQRFFADHPGLSVEAAGNDLLIYRYNKLTPPDALPGLLEEGAALVEVLSGR